MLNSYQGIGTSFDKLYIHAKSQVKSKKVKIEYSTSLKRSGHVKSKKWRLGGNLTGYTFMQNLGLKV